MYPFPILKTIARGLLLAWLHLWVNPAAVAQSADLSLAQAQQQALQNALSVKNARYDAEVADLTTRELLGIGLPQLSGSVQYQNFINLPTSVIPGEFFGAPGQQVKVQFGVPHQMTAGVSASQLLFNGSWLVGLQASRSYAALQEKQTAKSEQDVKKQVAESYQTALAVDATLSQLRESREILNTTLTQTQALLDAGFSEVQDVEQLQLTLNGLDVQIAYLMQQSKLAKDVLKVLIGTPLSTDIRLTDTIEGLMQETGKDMLNVPFAVEATPDYQVLQGALGMQQLNVKAKKTELLPNVAAFYNLQTQALRNQFDFLDTKQQWFPIQLWGLQLNVPILSGGSKMATIKKAEVEVRRYTDMLTITKTSLELEYRSARADFEYALNNLQQTKANVELSKSILEKTNIKFKEGIGTSFEITQNTNQVLQAQSSYIQAMQLVLNAQVRLAKSLNQL
jgi:outer membrane protein